MAAIEDVSFLVRRGTVVGLVGPPGSGKTTTLRALLGLVEPTSGEALFCGHRYHELVDPSGVVGANFGGEGVPPWGTARSHLRSLAAKIGRPARVEPVLVDAGLGDVADLRIGRLSRGTRQRLGVAGALLGEPATLVLDEPADGLDDLGLRWLHAMVRNFAGQGGTVLVASPVVGDVAPTADEIVVIRDGRVVLQAAVDELLAGAARTASVRIRTPHAGALAAALAADGHACLHLGAGLVRVHDMAVDELRGLASSLHVVIEELTPETPGLEETYLALIASPRLAATM